MVGLLVWWYHHAVLEAAGAQSRTELRRVYEYLMAGTGLLAAAAGLATVLVALIEALTGPRDVLVTASSLNTLLGALTLLVVGAPVWWVYWQRIDRAAQADPAGERSSSTRRIYLFILFGLGGVAAVVSLISGVYVLLEDALEGSMDAETVRRTRFAVGVLLTAGAVSAYHWAVYRSDRDHGPVRPSAPRFVLLVGPVDQATARAVAGGTGSHVQAWRRTDGAAVPWSVEEVVGLLEGSPAQEVIVLSDAGGLRVIPVERG